MFHLLTHACPKCRNTFKVETTAEEQAARKVVCKCPRCYTVATIRADAGEPRPQSTPWAVRATVDAEVG